MFHEKKAVQLVGAKKPTENSTPGTVEIYSPQEIGRLSTAYAVEVECEPDNNKVQTIGNADTDGEHVIQYQL